MRVILHAISPRLATRILSMRRLEVVLVVVFPWEKGRAKRRWECESVMKFLRSNAREAMARVSWGMEEVSDNMNVPCHDRTLKRVVSSNRKY